MLALYAHAGTHRGDAGPDVRNAIHDHHAILALAYAAEDAARLSEALTVTQMHNIGRSQRGGNRFAFHCVDAGIFEPELDPGAGTAGLGLSGQDGVFGDAYHVE